MAKGDLLLYVFAWSIDGTIYGGAGHAISQQAAIDHVNKVISRRNADIPTEKTEFNPGDLHFGVDDQFAEEFTRKIRAGIPEGKSALELSPDSPEMLLHKSVSQLESDRDAGQIQDVTSNLR